MGPLESNANSASALEQTLSPPSIRPGQRTRLTLTLQKSLLPTEYKLRIQPELNDTLITAKKDIHILEQDFIEKDDSYVWQFDLTSYHTGQVQIPPIEVRLGPTTYSTDAQDLSLVTSRAETDTEIRPEFGKLGLPIDWAKWALATLYAALTLTVAWILRKWAPRLKGWAKQQLNRPKPPDATAEQWLTRELKRIKLAMARGQDSETTIDELTDVLRNYFAKSTSLPVRQWTTGEFRKRLQSDNRTNSVLPLFLETDLVKFHPNQQANLESLIQNSIKITEQKLLNHVVL